MNADLCTEAFLLHRAIEEGGSLEKISSIINHYPGILRALDNKKRSPLTALHQKYYHTVFAGFHRKNSPSTLLHDEWYDNRDWTYVSNIATVMVIESALLEDMLLGPKAKQCIKKKSLAIHAALLINDCPIDIIRLLASSPWEIAGVEYKDEEGNLPLHLAVDKVFNCIQSGSDRHILEECGGLITDLLDMYPGAARVPNHNGQFPITRLIIAMNLAKKENLQPYRFESTCVLNLLRKQFSPMDELLQIVSDYSAEKDDKVSLLLSNLGAGTSRVDNLYNLLQRVPWILKMELYNYKI